MNRPDPRYPPAPELHGELLLDVFTHRSLRQAGGSRDNERYAVLGEKVFEASIANSIFICFPHFGRAEIMEEMAGMLKDENYEQWTKYYRLRDKLRYHADAHDEVNSPAGAREIFHAYMGGVYVLPGGPLTVNGWVYQLVVPPEHRPKQLEQNLMPFYPSQPPPPSAPYPVSPPPPPLPQEPSTFYSSHSHRNSFSSAMIVGIDGDESYSGVPYTTPSNGKPVYLPKFNEITTQRRLNVQYPAEQKGLQHAPRWVVRCLVDGKELGIGAATTKQLAKEEAAKQAFRALNLSLSGL